MFHRVQGLTPRLPRARGGGGVHCPTSNSGRQANAGKQGLKIIPTSIVLVLVLVCLTLGVPKLDSCHTNLKSTFVVHLSTSGDLPSGPRLEIVP